MDVSVANDGLRRPEPNRKIAEGCGLPAASRHERNHHEHGAPDFLVCAGPVFAFRERHERRLGYGMLCGPDPKRNDSWTLRVDVPPLRFGVVVRVDLHSCAGNVVPAVLDVENRADLGRERPSEAFPRTGQPETFRRYRAGEPYGASYWPLSGYGMLLDANNGQIKRNVIRIARRTI